MAPTTVREHGPFKDPVRLARRMVTVGGPAARSALVREAARLALRPVDAILTRSERRLLASAGSSSHPTLLIVGAPRSGTSLVQQVLASSLDVTYFSNLSALFPHAPLAASWAGRRLLRPRPDRLESYYGQTQGLAGPNDGFHIWDRFLGTERYTAPSVLPPSVAESMRRYLEAWRWRFDRPLLNKNNRNTDAIPALAGALPEAVFLVVRRNPFFVAQSLLRAREEVQGDAGRAWGLRSSDASGGGPIEAVARQVAEIERRLAADLARVPSERVAPISYESFCAEPAVVVKRVADRIGSAPVVLPLDPLQPAETLLFDGRVTDELRRGLARHGL